jgi:ABC-type multidrug transport system fused ATPase/permease subunit
LAHRSTSFESLTQNFTGKSNIQQIIEGVLLGNILPNQEYGYRATEKAIEYAKNGDYKYYSLSFTGHSLGAWLAQLSVFYCVDQFKYSTVQAVTFDGPGSREIMEKLKANNSDRDFSYMEIFSYFSKPNIFNCMNKHVGKNYCISTNLIPSSNILTNTIDDNISNDTVKNLMITGSKLIPVQTKNILIDSCQHELKYILCEFNPETGKPFEFKQVEKWPSISFDQNEFQKSSTNFNTLKSTCTRISKMIPSPLFILSFSIKLIGSLISWEKTTVDSIFHLMSKIKDKKLDYGQYSNFNNLLQESDESWENDFFRNYSAGFKLIEVNNEALKYNDNSEIDRIMKIIEINSDKLDDYREIKDLVNCYKYSEIKKEFRRKENTKIELEDIRDQISLLNHRSQEFVNLLDTIDEPRIVTNIESNINEDSIDLIKCKLKNSNILITTDIIQQLSNTSDIENRKPFVLISKSKFTIRLVNADSDSDLDLDLSENFKKCIIDCFKKCLNNKDEKISYETAKSKLNENLKKTKQKVLFIISNLGKFTHVIRDFINLFNNDNVKIMITTNNPELVKEKINFSTYKRLSENEELNVLMTDLSKKWYSQPNQEFFRDKIHIDKIHTFIDNFSIFIKKLKKTSTFSSNLQQKEHIFVIGPTGSGKSVIVNLLIGNELISLPKTNRNDPNIKLAISKKDEAKAEIGNSSKSETSFAQAFFSKINSNRVFWDFPGFFDTRGALLNIKFAHELIEVSREIKKFKILLVLENNTIYDQRGRVFCELLTALNQLVGEKIDTLRDCLSLIITKGEFSENVEIEIDQYIERFKEILREHNDHNLCEKLMHLYSDENMKHKIALFPKITRENKIIISQDYNLEVCLNKTKSRMIELNLINNIDTKDILGNQNQLLNEYMIFCSIEKILKKKEELKKIIETNDFKKDEIKYLKISSDNKHLDQVIDMKNSKEIVKYLMNSKIQKSYLKKTLQIINFLNGLLNNLKPDYDGWFKSFKMFNDNLDELNKIHKEQSEDKKNLKVKACILTASELNNIIHKELKEIKVIAFIFILDVDLELRGINFEIECPDWRVNKDQKVILSGDEDISNKNNSGNFLSGRPITVKGNGNLTFELNGLDGKPGEFNLELFKSRLKESEEKMKNLEKSLKAIKSLRKIFEKNQMETQPKLDENVSVKNRQIFYLIQKNINNTQKLSDLIKELSEKDEINLNEEDKNEINDEIDLLIKKISDELDNFRKNSEKNNDEEFPFLKTFKDIKSSLDTLSQIKSNVEDFGFKKLKNEIKELKEDLNKTHQINIESVNLEYSGKIYAEIIDKKENQAVEEIMTQTKKLEVEIKNLKQFILEREGDYKEFLEQYKIYKDLEEKNNKLLENIKLSRNNSTYPVEIRELINSIIEKEEANCALEEILFEKESLVNTDLNNSFKRKLLNYSEIKENFVYNLKEIIDLKDKLNNFSKEEEGKGIIDLIIKSMKSKLQLTFMELKNKIEKKLSKISSKCEKKELDKIFLPFFKETYEQIEKNFNEDNEELLKKLEIGVDKKIDQNIINNEVEEIYEYYYRENQKPEKDNSNYLKTIQEKVDNLNKANEKFIKLKKKFENYKGQPREILDEFLNVHKNFSKKSIKVENIVKKMLKHKELLIKTENNKQNETDGIMVKYIKFFIDDITESNEKEKSFEFYQINGTKGSPGSNSGYFESNFKNESNIKLAQNPGKGGCNSFLIQGHYLNESVFPEMVLSEIFTRKISYHLFVNIFRKYFKEKNKDIRPINLFSSFFGSFLLNIPSNPLEAFSFFLEYWNSRWISGPFLVEQGSAPDGNKVEVPNIKVWPNNEFDEFFNEMSNERSMCPVAIISGNDLIDSN